MPWAASVASAALHLESAHGCRTKCYVLLNTDQNWWVPLREISGQRTAWEMVWWPSPRAMFGKAATGLRSHSERGGRHADQPTRTQAVRGTRRGEAVGHNRLQSAMVYRCQFSADWGYAELRIPKASCVAERSTQRCAWPSPF